MNTFLIIFWIIAYCFVSLMILKSSMQELERGETYDIGFFVKLINFPVLIALCIIVVIVVYIFWLIGIIGYYYEEYFEDNEDE